MKKQGFCLDKFSKVEAYGLVSNHKILKEEVEQHSMIETRFGPS